MWAPDCGGGKVAVVQSEEYAILLQAWTYVTLLLEEREPRLTVVEVKVHLGGGGLMRMSFGNLRTIHEGVLAAFHALPVRVLSG